MRLQFLDSPPFLKAAGILAVFIQACKDAVAIVTERPLPEDEGDRLTGLARQRHEDEVAELVRERLAPCAAPAEETPDQPEGVVNFWAYKQGSLEGT